MLASQIEDWMREYQEALAALAEAETTQAHAKYALAVAKAQAEQHVRATSFGKRMTERAITAAVTLDPDVQACSYDALDAAQTLIAAKHQVEALRAQKTALAWLVSLELRQHLIAA